MAEKNETQAPVEATPQAEAAPQPEQVQGQNTPSQEEVVNAMRYMFKEMQDMKGGMEAIKGQMQAPAQAPVQATPQVAPQSGPSLQPGFSEHDADVEMMDNKDLVGYIEKRVTDAFTPWANQIQQMNDSSSRSNLTQEVNKLRSDETTHFDSFVNEVREVMEQKQGAVSVEEALAIAKAKDPEKVQRLTAEQQKNAPKGEPDPFVGLLPTSGKSSRSDRMDGKEAAQAAWEEIGLDDFVKEMPN